MPFKTKRIYDEPVKIDGYRVLVDRLWPRGITKDRAAIDLWLKDIAPSNELRKWFNHDAPKFADFTKRYAAEIGDRPEPAADLITRARAGETITLLYAAKNTEQNHAILLAEWLAEWAED